MDAKITLSFDEKIIARAKKYAEKNNISLSRLMEFVLDNITHHQYQSLEEMPIAEWVNKLAEGNAEYLSKPKNYTKQKQEFRNRKK